MTARLGLDARVTSPLRWVALAGLAWVAFAVPWDAADGQELLEAPLQPGDQIELSSWEEPEVAGQYAVDEDGYVILPHLGRRQVTNRSPAELRRELTQAYDDSFQGTDIRVTLQRRVRLLGEVGSPGLYHVDPTMTLGDLIAEAGGVTTSGDGGRIELARRGGTVTEVELRSDVVVMEALQSGDQITVPRQRWYRRHGSLVLSGLVSSVLVVGVRELLRSR